MNTKPMRLLLLCLVYFSPSFSQEKLSRHYTAKDGLASNTVYNALVDKQGYLWFATDAGVSLFDGTTFTNFSAKDGLADNEVLSMFQDNEGRIWFVCYNQQPCFYYDGKFFNAGNFKELQKVKGYYWHTLFIDQHEVWFSGKKEIYRFRSNEITEYPVPGDYGVVFITKVNGVIFILQNGVFYFLNEKSGKLEPSGLEIKYRDIVSITDNGNGNFILIDQPDNRHIALYKCIMKPAMHAVEKKFIALYDKELTKARLDENNHILSLSFADNDVIQKNALQDSMKTVAEYKFSSQVSDVAVDLQGNKWFTLLHNGVEMYPGIQSNVISLPEEAKKNSAFFSIGTIGNSIIASNNDNTLFFVRNGTVQETHHNSFYADNNRILDIKADKHNKIWLGTDNGICIYYPDKKQFAHLSVWTNVKHIKYDEINDDMLFASSYGAFIIPCGDTSRIIPVNTERTVSIAGRLNDTCWYETLNCLYLFTGKTSMPDSVLSDQFKSRVTNLELDKKKRLWVGTSSNGVFVTQYNSILYHFTSDDGLTSNICRNIFIDDSDQAWVSTNLGVSHIKIDRGIEITKYNEKNCLADDDVNGVAIVNDTVYVAGSSGINFFNRNDVLNKYSFPVYINKIKFPDSEIVVSDRPVDISTRHNTISISFTGLSYLSNGDIKYEYYIQELNEKPQFTKNNSVTFSGLSPGTYNFYVSATDAFGNKSMHPAHITFTIIPEWYQWLWLRWLLALAAAALTIFITFRLSRQKEKRKRLQSEWQQTISRLELEAIRSQINPHFVFNCLNAIQNAVHNNNAEKAGYFINRFAKLMRTALLLSKESFISIDEEYNFINNYLEVEQLRSNNKFDYFISIDPGLNKSTPLIPAFVLQPLVENSVNHGLKYLKNGKGLISVEFIKNGKLEIRLSDNGIGMKASNEINRNSLNRHASQGIALILARVESLNKIYNRKIEVKIIDMAEMGKNEQGTTVIISFDHS